MTTNNLPATAQAQAPVQVGLTDAQSFDLAQRVATCFSKSTLVPKQYQNNLPNCVIALNMAARMGADPMMVMQSLYIVHGNPSWSAQFLIATFNKCGRFSSIRYDFEGTNDQLGDDWGCRATATELSTGEHLTGPRVTIGLAKKEGWYQKAGSKWQTMPEQMLRYRAAAWFVRTIAPEIAMGLQTAEEMRDTYEAEPAGNGTWAVPPARGAASTDLNEIIDAQATPSAPPEPAQPAQSVEPLPAPDQHRDPQPQPERKRHTQAELEDMRAVLVQEIDEAGLNLKDVEAEAGEFSNRWTASVMDKIRSKIIPNLKAELAGA